MRAFIPSRGRANTCITHRLIPQVVDWKYVLHTLEEARAYIKAGIPEDRIVVSGLEYGLSAQRRFIVDTLVDRDEWFMMLDDNIQELCVLPLPYYEGPDFPTDGKYDAAARKLFNKAASWETFMYAMGDTLARAEKFGAHLCGFGSTDNYFFRLKKWRFMGLVVGKIMLIRRHGLTFDPGIKTMSDYEFSAAEMLHTGKLIINNWVYPKAGHFQAGGVGKYHERLAHKIKDAAYIMAKYPGLFAFNTKRKGVDHRSELRLAFHDVDRLRTWRLGALQTNRTGPLLTGNPREAARAQERR